MKKGRGFFPNRRFPFFLRKKGGRGKGNHRKKGKSEAVQKKTEFCSYRRFLRKKERKELSKKSTIFWNGDLSFFFSEKKKKSTIFLDKRSFLEEGVTIALI
jgi:hypothetical protein